MTTVLPSPQLINLSASLHSSTSALPMSAAGNDSGGVEELAWYVNNNAWWVITLEAMLYILLSATISCSAVLVITVVWRTSSLHSTPGFLMVIMSACDLLVSIILGAAVITVIKREFIFPQVVNIGMAVLFAMFQNANAMALMVSSIDQLISILKPLQYHMIVTTRRIVIAFTVMMLLSLGFVVLLAVLAYRQVDEDHPDPVYLDELVQLPFIAVNGTFLTVVSLGFFLVPGGVVTVSYSIILVRVIRTRTDIRNQTLSARRGSIGGGIQFLSHLKACKMLFVVTLLYFASFLPYMLLDRYIVYFDEEPLPPLWVYKCCTWLIFMQSMLNCIIFYKMNRKFKKGLAKLVYNVPVLNRIFPVDDPVLMRFNNLTTHEASGSPHNASISSSGRHNSIETTNRPIVGFKEEDEATNNNSKHHLNGETIREEPLKTSDC